MFVGNSIDVGDNAGIIFDAGITNEWISTLVGGRGDVADVVLWYSALLVKWGSNTMLE